MFDFIRARRPILVLALLFSVCALSTDIEAQGSAQERANVLRAQLGEVWAKQETLEARLRDLEEELKPGNIEKSFAGIGSTRPEDLREFRRRQLELEKVHIQTQLKLLAESQTRVEARIVQADADAYHESAGINPRRSEQRSAEQQPASASSVQLRMRRTKGNKPGVRRRYSLIQN
jgi:hypothetical protein